MLLPKNKRVVDEEYARWIRSQSCIVGGPARVDCIGPVECCHFKSRGAGGSDHQCFPACTEHHNQQHRIGIKTFQARYGLDLGKIVSWYREKYERTR